MADVHGKDSYPLIGGEIVTELQNQGAPAPGTGLEKKGSSKAACVNSGTAACSPLVFGES